MEIKITTKQMLKVFEILSWIIFIGVCIEAGGIIFNTLFVLFINPIAAENFWQGLNLSNLYRCDKGYFIVETVLMSIVSVMKAVIFYLLIKILSDKKFNFYQPFNKQLVVFISNLAYLSIGIGFFSYWGVGYTKWLTKLGIAMPNIQQLKFGGADVWIFMGITLLVIAQIFKRGVELQEESELTI